MIINRWILSLQGLILWIELEPMKKFMKLSKMTKIQIKLVILNQYDITCPSDQALNKFKLLKDNNGNYLTLGLTRGCDINGTISTGVALGDMNGYSLTITADEPMMSQFVTAALVTANIKASAGAPTQITP
jgi:hypothetical protein